MSNHIKKCCHPPLQTIGGRLFEACTTYPDLDSNCCSAFDTS